MIKAAAALSAALAIAAGAFGAHGSEGQAVDWLQTGSQYQLIHAVAAIAIVREAPRQALLMLAGSVLFALTLYLMAIGGPRWLGAVTPLGGLAMIVAWIWLGVSFVRNRGTT